MPDAMIIPDAIWVCHLPNALASALTWIWHVPNALAGALACAWTWIWNVPGNRPISSPNHDPMESDPDPNPPLESDPHPNPQPRNDYRDHGAENHLKIHPMMKRCVENRARHTPMGIRHVVAARRRSDIHVQEVEDR